MLRSQILFFIPLAASTAALAWASEKRAWVYSVLSAGSILLAAGLLYVVMALVTPEDGLLHAPTLLLAYVMPVALIAAVLWLVRARLALLWRLTGAMACAAAVSWLAPTFLLAAVCVAQANCL